jgi:dipeptidyl aminopeptidase/acylaminoacyl peptidase
MTQFADRGYFLGGSPASPVAIFSPNGKQFLLRLKKGDVERNVVQYSLLLFETDEVFHSPVGKELVTMSSSSNREGIQQVRWQGNHAVVFLGEAAGETPQVFRVDLFTRRRVQLTHHATPVVSYDISKDGKVIVYEAAPSPHRVLESVPVQKKGVVITSQTVDDLLNDGQASDDPRTDRELFVQGSDKTVVKINSPDFLTEYLPLVLSPDSHYAVLAVYLSNIPSKWSEYEDKVLHRYIVDRRKPGTLSNIQQYMLVDTRKGTIKSLLDAPKAWLDEGVAWSGDSDSVILSGAYLPLKSGEASDAKVRRMQPFVVEVDISSGEIHTITDERLRILHWQPETHRLTLETGYGIANGPSQIFEKVNKQWHSSLPRSAEEVREAPLEITLEEDANTAPRIIVKDRSTGERNPLLDLNPQFAGFQFARVETVRWKATDGHEVEGGLYFPPEYLAGQRYPLVIQTHGFEPDRFWINGPWDSAFAAQPLAAEGIFVLQVGNATEPGQDREKVNTPGEGPWRMAVFEGAVDELDRRGLIDRDRVGLIGFSRTAFHVAFTLTHSKYPFRAATMADGFEAGFLNYLLARTADYVGVNGGEPVGAGLRSWLDNSPGFGLENVSTPVRLEYYGPQAFLGGWQWFALLSSIGKPVDFVWIPQGTHLLVKPWERLISQQGNVDWFRFWLCGKETCDSKSEACARWQELAASAEFKKQ